MNIQFLNLVVAILVSLCYLIASIKLLTSFFHGICKPMTHATVLLFASVLLGFGLTLHQFSEIATNAMYFHASNGNLINGIWYWVLFAAFAFGFSFMLFYGSFILIGVLTHENEKAELGKNNYYIGALHAVVFILLCLMVTKPLTDLANTLVSYPKFPD